MSKIKLVGSILNSKTALNIVKLLMKKEMSNVQIANKLNRKEPLTHFHIQRLLKLKLLSVRKGDMYSRRAIFYKIKPGFVKIITTQIVKEFRNA